MGQRCGVAKENGNDREADADAQGEERLAARLQWCGVERRCWGVTSFLVAL